MLRKNNVDASKTWFQEASSATIAESFSERISLFMEWRVWTAALLRPHFSQYKQVFHQQMKDWVTHEDAFNDIKNSIIDYDEDEYDPSWHPDMEAQSELLLEEEDTVEEDSDCNDSDDPDYVPLFRVCFTAKADL
ncbi:unnamed protein product [Gadus morhua 'NCC']